MDIMPAFVDKETEQKRKSICKDCDESKLGFCKKCGCVIITKVKWELNTCPLAKW